MKYLFFDIECASVKGGSKICSFGYVLTDENMNILKSEDIIINPQSEWDWYALKYILAYPQEYYESFPSFDKQYNKIKSLFEGDVIAFGHGITNDVKFINDDCRRYKLPCIDFVFYDCADIYKEFENSKNIKSLAKVSSNYINHAQSEKHESKEDAVLVYEYMKKMCEDMETSLEELLKLTPRCKGVNLKGICKYRNINNKEKKTKDKGQLYDCFIENVKPITKIKNSPFNNKTIAISLNCEKGHFKEMLLVIQLLTNCGAKYTENAREADVFVSCDEYCMREIEVDEVIDEGKNIEKIDVHEFLEMLEYDSRYIEENYKRVCKEIIKIINENKKVKTL